LIKYSRCFGNVHCSSSGVSRHYSNILIYNQHNATLHRLLRVYLGIALHVSGGTSTHHQERKQIYLQHLVFVTPLLLHAAIMVVLERSYKSSMIPDAVDIVVCAPDDGWRYHPKHVEQFSDILVIYFVTLQRISNSSMIAACSSNGVTNTRCCRYSSLRYR